MSMTLTVNATKPATNIKIYTYFKALPDINSIDERKLICLWTNAWREQGLEPVVLNERVASRSPLFQLCIEAYRKLPSINPRDYDLACFLRWLAVGVMRDDFCFMSDYDCLPTKHWPGKVFESNQEELTVHQWHVPCLVGGPGLLFENMALEFAGYEPKQTNGDQAPHVSDQCVLEGWHDRGIFKAAMNVLSHGEQNWKEAAAVHFPNGAMTPHGLTPKWKHVPGLLHV